LRSFSFSSLTTSSIPNRRAPERNTIRDRIDRR
jgi:hypothetical protein